MPAAQRGRRLAFTAVALLVLFRSAVFVFWEQAHFDSDQAITGLMAKHLSEGRAFPVFWYGQNYMLAVEAWLAAPVFLVAGVSVAALKLPLLAINLAVAILLVWLLERDAGLRPGSALVAALFFVVPAPGTAARYLEANGGNVEPLLYTLLIWITRRVPAVCGAILGVGFLNREFTLYAGVALLVIGFATERRAARETLRHWLTLGGTAAGVWLAVQWLKRFSSAAGPGTTIADVFNPRDNLSELFSRTCFDPRSAIAGMQRIATEHWPVLFGTRAEPVRDFGIESSLAQGLDWSWILLASSAAIAVAGIVGRIAAERRWDRRYDLPAYLVLVAALSIAGYVMARCGEVGFYFMRYELLSIVGAAGLGAWFLAASPPRLLAVPWTAVTLLFASVAGVAHARLLAEYVTNPPVGAKQAIVRQLENDGVRYATSDYWLAYALTFMSDESVIVASEDLVRIPSYNKAVREHEAGAIRISRQPCANGRVAYAGVYFCPRPP